MENRKLAVDRVNFMLIGSRLLIGIFGFILMSGGGSTEEKFDPEIFNTMHTTVAPIVCFIGFVSMIYGVMRKPKDD